ncbi:MAG: CRISPR-associated endonuclease Cas1 [Flexibacter sp. CG_4_10_14_3_um_filter_32_15]|nr:MAG: CRISPR-associated endonuclease Cas1 [Flexibacter sp. CG_4_10_14_3_um_filter_32_15]
MQIVIHTKGTYLKKSQNMFEIRTENDIQKISAEDIDTIFLAKGTLLTTDVILFALSHNIEIIFTDYHGTAKGRIWNNKFGSTPLIRRNQAIYSTHTKPIQWIKTTLIEKISNQIAFLHQISYGVLPNGATTQRRLADAIEQMTTIQENLQAISIKRIKKKENDWKDSFRGHEGSISRIYFQALSYSLPHSYQFDGRSMRPAQDKFNCLLNYGYGMMYGYVQGALIRAGLDPSLGILHADQYNSAPTLAFDLIEKYRIWVDTVAFRLCQSYSFKDEDFIPKGEQGVWLHGNGKRKFVKALHDYLHEVIPQKNVRRSRLHHIQLDAQSLAQLFLGLSE